MRASHVSIFGSMTKKAQVSGGSSPSICPTLNETLMINFKKLKSQIHRGTGYVFVATGGQMKSSDWQIYNLGAPTKRKLIKLLVSFIHDKSMNHWRKEFTL